VIAMQWGSEAVTAKIAGPVASRRGLYVVVFCLWRPFSGLQRHYASSGTSRLRCW
jgi:hypothetical protein